MLEGCELRELTHEYNVTRAIIPLSFFFIRRSILVDVINFCLDELLTSMWICAFNAKRDKFKLSVRFIYKYGQENANRSIYHYFHDKMSLVLFVFFNLHNIVNCAPKHFVCYMMCDTAAEASQLLNRIIRIELFMTH